ncbi:MAG: carbamate kinase [Pseudomonadota bacterium]
MRVVAALGGNALLKRGEPMTAENQRANARIAAAALAEVARAGHRLVISHGNGPQVGLLALQGLAYKPAEAYPLDLLNAETEGMIGYLIEQELRNALPEAPMLATLLTQVEVDPADPAFHHPTKPIGPIYEKAEAERLAKQQGWSIALDGDKWRRVVASPRPRRIVELDAIEALTDRGATVICAGGGGIPAARGPDGRLEGVEAVIDKDLAAGLLARALGADAFLMLTDVDAVYQGWGAPHAKAIRRASPQALSALRFAAGSMGPKVEAACEFVTATSGLAGIGRLEDARAILEGRAGTLIAADVDGIVFG